MRHSGGFTILAGFSFAATTILAGCSGSPNPVPAADAAPATAPKTNDAAAEAQAYADRVAAAMAPRSETAPPPDIRWLEPGSEVPSLDSSAPSEPQRSPAPDSASPSIQPAVPVDPVAQAPVQSHVKRPAAKDPALSELLQKAAAAIEASDRPALRKAIDAATLRLVDPAQPLNRHLLESLTFDQRGLVERYHQVLSLLLDDIANGDSDLDRRALDARLDALFGQQPIAIRDVELCRRVMGYGIYEPFEKSTFLAGASQKMIVYVELEHFQTQELDDGQYEVKLEQEMALFNESDGLAVWRNEPVQIVDTSRNRRRDFFVVQLVTLPARLTVGKYRLKVRVTDLHGGSLDETTIPLQIVADESMVQR